MFDTGGLYFRYVYGVLVATIVVPQFILVCVGVLSTTPTAALTIVQVRAHQLSPGTLPGGVGLRWHRPHRPRAARLGAQQLSRNILHWTVTLLRSLSRRADVIAAAAVHFLQAVTVAGTIAASISIYLPHRFAVATYPLAVADKIDALVAANVRLAKFTANRERQQQAERNTHHKKRPAHRAAVAAAAAAAATAAAAAATARATTVGLVEPAPAATTPRQLAGSDLGLPLRSRDESGTSAGSANNDALLSDHGFPNATTASGRRYGGSPATLAAPSTDRSGRDRRVVILPPNVWRGANFVHPYLGSRSYLVPATAQVRSFVVALPRTLRLVVLCLLLRPLSPQAR